MKALGLILLAVSVGVSQLAFADKGWRVAELNGAPGLYHDGKPVPAMMFWQWEPQEKDTRDMSAAGMDIFAMFGSFPHYRNPYWRKDGSFGMAYQDSHIDNLLSWAPKAAFLPRIFYTAPDWWSVANQSERHVYAPGRKGMQVRESFASLKCREELSPYYRKAVRHLIDRYGDHLMGIHVANGPCGEHFSWDVWGHEPSSAWGDLSEPMRQAFVRYLRRKYGNDVARLREAFKDTKADFETVTLPGREERCMAYDGWRDPAKGRRVMDYLECCNEVTVEMIDHYCGIVKDESKGTLSTLAFYGYVAEDTWANENDHRGTSKMYLSKNLDMLSAPHSYRRRKLGEDGMQRQYLASAALHGKLFIDEGDDMTHLEKRKKRPDRRCTVNTMEESLALLYREFGVTVTHGTGLWYMDLTRGTFRDPQIVDAVGRMRKWAEVALRYDRSHHSEVAVVSQPQSGFYIGHGGKFAGTVIEQLYVKQMGEFYRAGAPFDWYLAEDLDAVVKGKAKVVAFLDCQYLSDEQYALALKLKEQGRKLVFFHAPAYVSQTVLSWERVKRLTGGETFETLRFRSADELRGIYKEAGVHVYTDSDVVLSANSAWLMLHTREAGDYKIALPRKVRKVTEITTEKVIAENADGFTLNLPKHSTAVFLLEPIPSAKVFEEALAATEAKTWKSADGRTLPYRLHVPAKPEPGKLYPLVVHMHGAGSWGTNNVDQIRTGGADFISWAKRHGEEYVFIAPQTPRRCKWVDSPWENKKSTMKETPTASLRMAMEIIDDAIARYPVDRDRVYVMGISMGGYAAWELMQRCPELFAAGLPCCGGGDVAQAPRLTDIPIWAFHGSNDKSVPVCRSRDMVAAIKAAGGKNILYREYKGLGHNVWTPTFSDDKVFEWLFSQRRRLIR